MSGPRKPSARVRATPKKGAVDDGGGNEDHQVKSELENDAGLSLASLKDGSTSLIPLGQPLQASTSPSTPGHGVSSSPMPPSSAASGQLVQPPGRKKGAPLILWNFDEKPVPYRGSSNGRQSGRNLIQWSRKLALTQTFPVSLEVHRLTHLTPDQALACTRSCYFISSMR